VISKLEVGLRASISLGDLFVLAEALSVPPLALIAPLDSDDLIEVLPGEYRTPWEAADWFFGSEPLENEASLESPSAWSRATYLYDVRLGYLEAVRKWRGARDSASRYPERPAASEMVEVSRQLVDHFRDELARSGVKVPPLPEDEARDD